MKSGIYTITTPPGKRYVGSSLNIPRRWSGHRSLLRRGIHTNPKLQRAWDKYGEDAIAFEILTNCGAEELVEQEQRAIDALFPEYNIRRVADRNTGVRHSESAKRQISQAMTGRILSDETRMRMSSARKGIKFTPEHCENISKSGKGKPRPRAKGAILAPAHKAAIGAKMRGVAKSPEARANMLAARHARMIREREEMAA